MSKAFKRKHFDDEFIEITVDGIPAYAVVGDYSPGCSGARDRVVINGRAMAGPKLEPDEPPTVRIRDIYDSKGYPAEWLKRKIDQKDLYSDIMEQIGDAIPSNIEIEPDF